MYVELEENVNSAHHTLGEGLQPGAVNSPILFNIYICDVLRTFGLNRAGGDRALGFADDIILYSESDYLFEARNKLQNIFRKIKGLLETWKLTCNVAKCETILFRTDISEFKKKAHRRVWRNFSMSASDDGGVG